MSKRKRSAKRLSLSDMLNLPPPTPEWLDKMAAIEDLGGCSSAGGAAASRRRKEREAHEAHEKPKTEVEK